MVEPPAVLLVLQEEQRWWSHLIFLLKPSHMTVNKSAGGEFHGCFSHIKANVARDFITFSVPLLIFDLILFVEEEVAFTAHAELFVSVTERYIVSLVP